MPTICFGFQGHISAVPLYAELRGRSLRKFNIVTYISLFACMVAYNLTGFMGECDLLGEEE
jgi:sodium-coupled neutral amino acid transporter 7/8